MPERGVTALQKLSSWGWSSIREVARGALASRVALVALGLLLGYLIFTFPLGGVPQVALIEGPTGVIDQAVAQQIGTKLRLAAEDPQVKAVVIRVDSPGGLASASEDIFTNVLHLREQKPVVVVVDGLAASGAYFMSVAANHIVAKGSSSVGNVGAILRLPGDLRPEEREVSTGPFKLTGGSQRTYLKILELVKEGFAEAVLSQREGKLRLDREHLLDGRIYLGIEAVQFGLVDELGTQVDAVRKAAELAGLRRYDVVSLEKKYQNKGLLPAEEASASKKLVVEDLAGEFPYVYYLFVPP